MNLREARILIALDHLCPGIVRWGVLVLARELDDRTRTQAA